MEVMEIDQQPAQQIRHDLSEPIRNLEEERRKLNDDRRLLDEERRAFDLEKQALEKEQHKLQKLINFKKRVQEELEVFWKEKQSEGEQAEDDATTKTAEQPEKAKEEEPEDEDMTVNIKSLLHRLLKREQEISEQNISMSLSSRTGSRRKGGEEGVDDITNPLATDDADFVLEEEYDSDMDEHDLVLDESFSSSESDADKKDKKKKKKKIKKKLKKQEKKRRKGKKHKKCGRGKEKDLGDVFAESKEAVGSLLDAASHQEKMEQLKAFRDKFGHCKVPWAWKDNPQLGRWVGRMRSMKRNGKLDEAVQKELESMDFVWNPITENSTQWDEKLGQLKQFRTQNGHLKVPWGWKDNPALGRWVGRIRQQRRDGRLQPERIKELTEMGFVWEFANAPNKNKKNKRKRKESKQEKKEKKKDKKAKEKKKDKKHKKQKLSDHQDDNNIPAAGEKKETNGEPNGQSKKTEITIEDEEESGFAELAFASEEAAKIRSRLKEDEEDSSNV